MLRLSGVLGDAGLVEDLDGGGGAEVCPVPENPDDFLVGRDFDELRAFSIFAARTDDGVAIDEAVGLGEIGGTQLPNCFFLRVHFAGEDVVLIGDERVAVGEADGGPGALYVVAPDLLEVLVVFDDLIHLEERR